MPLSRWSAVLLACALLCAATALWVDAPVMRFLGRHSLIYQQWLQIPVYIFWAMLALPATALAIVSVMWLRRRTPPRETAILALAGFAMLATFALTDLVLKPLFGRSAVHEFFLSPPRFGFAFFSGDLDGTFPSGHAAMALAALAVLWRFYPRWRWLYGGFAALLMLSLVVTRDHFLSDIVAGAFIGIPAGALAARAGALKGFPAPAGGNPLQNPSGKSACR